MIPKTTPANGTWRASQLRKLTPSERDAILAEAALQAEADYRSNPQLTDFEAFGEDDLHGESTSVPEK